MRPCTPGAGDRIVMMSPVWEMRYTARWSRAGDGHDDRRCTVYDWEGQYCGSGISGIWYLASVDYSSPFVLWVCGSSRKSRTHAARSIIHCRRSRQPVGRVLRVWPNGLTVSDVSGAHRTWLHIIILLIILCAAYILYTLEARKSDRSRPRRRWARAFLFRPFALRRIQRYYNIIVHAQIYLYMRWDLIARCVVCIIW